MQDHPQPLHTWVWDQVGFSFWSRILIFWCSCRMGERALRSLLAEHSCSMHCSHFSLYPGQRIWAWDLHGWDGALSQLGMDVPNLPGQDNHKEQLQWALHECPKSCWRWLFSLRDNHISAPPTDQGGHKLKLLPCCSAGVWQRWVFASGFVLVQLGPTDLSRHRFQSKEEVLGSRKQTKPQQLTKMFSSLIS